MEKLTTFDRQTKAMLYIKTTQLFIFKYRCLKLILYSNVLIWLVIFQPTFVVWTVSVVRITNASLSDVGAMVTLIVQKDQMRKIAVVRSLSFFHSCYCLFYVQMK